MIQYYPVTIDTNIINTPTKIFLAGIPLTPVVRIAYAILNAATDPDMSTSGSAYMLLDDGPVLRLENEVMKSGVYDVMSKRVKWIQRCVLSSFSCDVQSVCGCCVAVARLS